MLKNSRSFAMELLKRLCEKNTDMADSDRIKITEYVCETQISLNILEYFNKKNAHIESLIKNFPFPLLYKL